MKDDKATLSQVGGSLSTALRNLTENYRLGFGSFADKPVSFEWKKKDHMGLWLLGWLVRCQIEMPVCLKCYLALSKPILCIWGIMDKSEYFADQLKNFRTHAFSMDKSIEVYLV